MNKILGTLVAILCAIQVSAQANFRPGYIINNHKDTIQGWIDYTNSNSSSNHCSFKKDPQSAVQTYQPQDLFGYRFTNSKFYVSKTIQIDSIDHQVFLEFLIEGKVDMYYYRKLDTYFIEKGNRMFELKNTREIVTTPFRYEKSKNEYIGALAYLLQDANMDNEINQSQLTHKSMIHIAKKYHELVCDGDKCIVYEKQLPPVKKLWGVVAGINEVSISQISSYTENETYLQNSNWGMNFYPSIGIFYKASVPEINENLWFQYEGTYSYMQLSTKNTYYDPLYSINYFNDIKWSKHELNNLVLLKYDLSENKIRPTLQIGGFLNYAFNTDYIRNFMHKNSIGNVYGTNSTTNSPFTKIGFGINAGLGFSTVYNQKKEMYVDLRYQRGYGFSQSLVANTLSLNLGFQINK